MRSRDCSTVGPVTNLEEHVQPDWWRKLFNKLYLKTDGDVVEDPYITIKEVDLIIKATEPSQQERILDLCCGQGRHSLELARRGFNNVEGVDQSRYLIKKAKSTAKRENLSVKFFECDVRKLRYPADSFDVVIIMGNSFGYFDNFEDDLKVLNQVRNVLRPNGRVLIDVADGEYLRGNFQTRSWEWIDKRYFVCRERSLSKCGERLISREVVTDATKGIIADQFYAERLYTRQTLIALLKEAGFENSKFICQLSPDSQRNQDLGMMQQRIITVAAF